MAFQEGRLNGIYDFGDAGIGARHRDFVYASFISGDLVRRMLPIYSRLTGVAVDPRRVAVLTGWHRLWELVTDEPENRPIPLMQYRAWAQDGLAEAIA
jgi:hypothetical protein